MKHSIEWRNDAVNAAPEERATVADLRLFVDGQNVTKHMSDDRVTDHVTASLYGLANGLVHDWWTIMGSRDREFSLTRYRTGYLLPDVRIGFDGAAFEFSAHQCVYGDPDIRFWGGMTEVLSRNEGRQRLCSLVEDVLDRLRDEGMNDTSASLRWRRVQGSSVSSEAAFCEAAGSLGLDPYAIDDGAATFIERAERLFGSESLVEFVSGSQEIDRDRLIGWVEAAAGSRSLSHRLAELRPTVEAIAKEKPSRADERPWGLGYRKARAMRAFMGLPPQKRFASFRDLAQCLGASKSYGLAPMVDGINALRREGPHGIHVHVRNHGDSRHATAMHLFAMARAIGDAACFPGPDTAPVNRLRHAYRQAAGRAFAAEFLAPIDEIRSMRADEHDEYSIANAFGVSPAVIEHQLENEDRIDRACI